MLSRQIAHSCTGRMSASTIARIVTTRKPDALLAGVVAASIHTHAIATNFAVLSVSLHPSLSYYILMALSPYLYICHVPFSTRCAYLLHLPRSIIH